MKYTDTRTPKVLAYLFTLILTSILAGLFLVSIPDENKTLINVVITSVLSTASLAVGFHLNSSAGSKVKDSMRINEPEEAKPPVEVKS